VAEAGAKNPKLEQLGFEHKLNEQSEFSGFDIVGLPQHNPSIFQLNPTVMPLKNGVHLRYQFISLFLDN